VGVGVGMVPTVGVGVVGDGVGVGVGVGVVFGGVNVSLVTKTDGAVGLVTLEPSQAAMKTADRTTAMIRVIPYARATAIPRAGRRFVIAESATASLESRLTRRSG
jgi:hypothetical protein